MKSAIYIWLAQYSSYYITEEVFVYRITKPVVEETIIVQCVY